MTSLKQRALDLHSSIPTFEAIKDVQLDKISHANRISELVRHLGDGGPGLSEDAPQVQSERRLLERAEAEFVRLQTLREVRTARWNTTGQLERGVCDWLLRGGVPHGCALDPVDDPPLSELLKKGETIANAVERFRHRRREQLADLHRVRSSPWPSSVAKAAAKAQIEMLAEAAAPDVDRCVEQNLPVGFMTTRLTAMVHNVDARGAVAFSELPDTLGLMCWLWHDQMLAKINAAIDEAADDKSALDEKNRAEMEATIMSDVLMTERSEVACIWAAEAKTTKLLISEATPRRNACWCRSPNRTARGGAGNDGRPRLRYRLSRRAAMTDRAAGGCCLHLSRHCTGAGLVCLSAAVPRHTPIRTASLGHPVARRRVRAAPPRWRGCVPPASRRRGRARPFPDAI